MHIYDIKKIYINVLKHKKYILIGATCGSFDYIWAEHNRIEIWARNVSLWVK